MKKKKRKKPESEFAREMRRHSAKLAKENREIKRLEQLCRKL